MQATFMIRAKVDQYTQESETIENRVRYYISRLVPYEIQEENQMLLSNLK